MVICLFGAASDRIPEVYIRAGEALGEEIARRGHSLIYGGGNEGMMGAAARGMRRCGGKVTGVVPGFFKENPQAVINEACDELIFTETLSERKALMEARAEAFVAVPGGIGTMEEFLEVLSLRQLRQMTKPIAQFNVCGYFNTLNAAFAGGEKEGFIREPVGSFFRPFSEPAALLDYLEQEKH